MNRLQANERKECECSNIITKANSVYVECSCGEVYYNEEFVNQLQTEFDVVVTTNVYIEDDVIEDLLYHSAYCSLEDVQDTLNEIAERKAYQQMDGGDMSIEVI